MHIKNVLRTYSLLRQLTDDESALLETLRGVTDTERELLVETLSPQKSTTKRAGKKGGSKGASKSSRASGMAAAISAGLQRGQPLEPLCLICGHGEDYEDHLQPSPNYHPFDVPPHVRSAGGKSSTNGGTPAQARDTQNPALPSRSESDDQESRNVSSSAQNSEDETVSAGAVVGGSSE